MIHLLQGCNGKILEVRDQNYLNYSKGKKKLIKEKEIVGEVIIQLAPPGWGVYGPMVRRDGQT